MTNSPESSLDVRIAALKTSVARLRTLVAPLAPAQLRASAFPSEWTVADVLSHIGSGAVIHRVRLDAIVAGTELADDFAQPIWDEWNAKTPEAKAADALVADRALVDRIDEISPDERARFRISLGPIEADFLAYLGLRINEHALHTWDVEVAFDPHATVAPDSTRDVIDNLSLITRFTAKPTGALPRVHVHTTAPERTFTLNLDPNAVSLTSVPAPKAGADSEPRLDIPAEAFIRLVYGRLDAAHTPPSATGTAELDELRRTFPGP